MPGDHATCSVLLGAPNTISCADKELVGQMSRMASGFMPDDYINDITYLCAMPDRSGTMPDGTHVACTRSTAIGIDFAICKKRAFPQIEVGMKIAFTHTH